MQPLTTVWMKGPGQVPLYSDWSVSITAASDSDSNICSFPCKDNDEQHSDSISVSSEVTVVSDNTEGKSQDEQQADHQSSSDSSENQPQDKQQQEAIFSVHRNMIGPKSVFFTQTFIGEQKSESSNSSVIELPPGLPPQTFDSVVDAFEVILEYCYNGKVDVASKLKLTTENAVPMFCLCNYLGMDSDICGTVRDFIKSDLSHETVVKYYQVVKDLRSSLSSPAIEKSTVLDANPIMDMVVILCHQSPSVLDSQTDLFRISDLPLWLSVGSSLANHMSVGPHNDENTKTTSAQTSKIWSENLTHFFDANKEHKIVDFKDHFRTLTSENILPQVSSKVALRLLEYEHNHGLAVVTRRGKKEEETVDAKDDDTISTLDDDSDTDNDIDIDNDIDVDIDIDSVVEEKNLENPTKLTSLQKRCVQALCESNWFGEENDLEPKRGTLIDLTTPAVLETLLINSVTGSRVLGVKLGEMEAQLTTRKKSLEQQIEAYEFKKEETKVEVAMERQKNSSLQRQLLEAIKECEAAKQKLKKIEGGVEEERETLCKANALLEAELEEEKKKSHSLDKRYRAMEAAHFKTEVDREMYELTVKDTIKRLDDMYVVEDEYAGCGLEAFILMLSATGDRQDCSKIKGMLQQVLKDPLSYERDFLCNNDSKESAESYNESNDSFQTDA